MIWFLDSVLSITMLELPPKLSLSSLIEACMHCIQLLSKVCIEQRLKVFVYVCDKVPCVLAWHFDHV